MQTKDGQVTYLDAVTQALRAEMRADPDVFLIGAQRLGVNPAACAVIEDAPVGIRAAVAAGMLAIGVATTHPEADLRAAGAAHVFANPSAIDAAALVAMLRDRGATIG